MYQTAEVLCVFQNVSFSFELQKLKIVGFFFFLYFFVSDTGLEGMHLKVMRCLIGFRAFLIFWLQPALFTILFHLLFQHTVYVLKDTVMTQTGSLCQPQSFGTSRALLSLVLSRAYSNLKLLRRSYHSLFPLLPRMLVCTCQSKSRCRGWMLGPLLHFRLLSFLIEKLLHWNSVNLREKSRRNGSGASVWWQIESELTVCERQWRE